MDPYTQLLALLDSGTPCCAVLVVSAVGSTPREAGVRAVVEGDGRIHGTVGGGAVEARAQAAAIEACRTGRAAILDCELSGDDAADCDPICGGRMRLLVDPTAVKDRSAYEQAARALARRERGVLVTEVDTGHGVRTRVCWREGSLPPGDPAAPETFVELVAPEPLLVIAGGGHIGQALARQAILIGFQVTVIEDRPEYAAPSLFPVEATARCGDIAETLGALPSDGDTYFVIVTRGHRHDAAALRACLRKPAAYIGMIGSRRKVALLRERFLRESIATEEQLDAIYAPIGLDIGAETVPEIAAAIAAQLIAVRRRGHGPREPRDLRDP